MKRNHHANIYLFVQLIWMHHRLFYNNFSQIINSEMKRIHSCGYIEFHRDNEREQTIV